MKCFCLYMMFFLLLSVSLPAQNQATRTSANQGNKNVQPGNVANNQPLSSRTDSLKMAMNDLKTSFHTIFGNKRDTISIYIANIEYDDANLSALKDGLRKVKGVKAVNMHYKQSTAMLDISYNGKSSDLWDKLPPEARSPFKLLEAEENSITLQYKNAISARQ